MSSDRNIRQCDIKNRIVRPILFLIVMMCVLPMQALVIKGDVYGGGKSGKVGSAENVASSTVDINSGSIRTIYGGGQDGKVYGTTTVTIAGGEIGDEKWDNTPFGGVFGAGEGEQATVFGTSNVTITGGTIINNVYGGGKMALLEGNADVYINGGVMKGAVYAGAKMADILGRAYLWIEGSDKKLFISSVYGGNDISGSMLKDIDVVKKPDFTFGVPSIASGDEWKTWNSFVRITSTGQYPIIGNLYGGGNGDYPYTVNGSSLSLVMDIYKDCPANERITFENLQKPLINKTYIDITGGCFGYVYGGGNNATVTEQTEIYFNRPNTALPSITEAEFENMHLKGELEGFDYIKSDDMITPLHHVSRMFGGNNKVDMAIRPKWHLISGSIGDLYSGGNEGAMTHPKGIYIGLTSANMTVGNIYGGCRMADVRPTPASSIEAETFDGYEFASGYAARVLIAAGNIQNVYGGNDISGKVQYGTNVQIRGIVTGDVYGGGNGSYAYTDNASWADTHPIDADRYYNPGTNSVLALNAFRPNVERSFILVEGNDAAHPAIVGGSVYCGGNSATLVEDETNNMTSSAILRIGKNIRLNNMFLGSNGLNMIDATILSQFADRSFSSINLANTGVFADYMDGASSATLPSIEWNWDESAETVDNVNAYIGSFFCGGNVGSMTSSKAMTLDFPKQLVIFSKIVGGCNTANVAAGTNNASRIGGVTVANTGSQASMPKITLNVRSKLEPRVLSFVNDANGFITSATLDWNNTTYRRTLNGTSYPILNGANIYGGCYASGVVNGGVTLNISENLISDKIMSEDKYFIGENVPFGDYVYSTALNAFGGGYGVNTEIIGSTNINVLNNGRIMKVFGGGEMGVVSGSATVTLDADLISPDGTNNYNVLKVYGGGLKGDITGDVRLYVEGGKLKDAFGGSCVANIDGSTFVKVGDASRVDDANNLFIKGNVYGGNDFGGQIVGNALYSGIGNNGKDVRTQTLVSYYSGVIDGSIFGAANGAYDYNQVQPELLPVDYPKLNIEIEKIGSEITTNSFVLIASPSVKSDRIIGSVYGGGQGYAGYKELVDAKQTYVRLAATGTFVQRTTNAAGPLVDNVFGGGYYSAVDRTLVDAENGYYNRIYGGTVGQTLATLNANTSYDCNETFVNIYGVDNTDMEVFGAGAMSGVDGSTNVTLYGGNVGYVYGGSFMEGGCVSTNVTIPAGSTFRGKAVYGGSVGSSDDLPCDVSTSNVTLSSTNSYLSEGIVFGGNRNYRATDKTNVVISVPMRKSAGGDYLTIYGAGDGEHTIAGHTNVNLLSGAVVNTVFGAARNGKVYNRYDNKNGASVYYSTKTDKYAHWTYSIDEPNAEVNIASGVTVKNNVYGGGLGAVATVSGTTAVNLIGGTVEGDIYGGGYSGSVSPMTVDSIGCSGIVAVADELIGTFNNIIGGRVRNVYGGCYAGAVRGETTVNIGLRETIAGTVLQPDNSSYAVSTFSWGKPVVQRSVYGGGEKGRVTTSLVNMNNGYVGYDYIDSKYVPKLAINSTDASNLLKENGNLYGGGYGEGAITLHAQVKMYDGTIRNGLYGGGEIASVGYAKTIKNDRQYSMDNSASEIAKREAGDTKVYMYGGLVEGDIFGGGRGFSYNTEGALLLGEHFYSDGFVFGSTEVNINRGIIGTDESLENGHGNVFGGGNVGYVFSLNGTKRSDGYYYDSNNNLTEDCRVVISSSSLVKSTVSINGVTYQAGDFVPVDDLNTLSNTDSRWNSLDDLGINIRNAVFAGGNVTQGTDIVYADAVTILGNVTATVADVFDCDFITIGDDGVGGLYGDGNLTLVDGYRELNVTNYGTDYNHLSGQMSYEDYLQLHPRKKAYYELKYRCLTTHLYKDYRGKIHEYEVGDVISGAIWEKMVNRNVGQNNEGTDEEQSMWKLNGFATLYAGRMLNTIQRADFCAIFGSKIVLKGARDRVTNSADFTNYTINRIGELSLNKQNNQGCYFGIYNVVNMLGGLTSDIDFDDVRNTDESESNYAPEFAGQTYYQWKEKYYKVKGGNNAIGLNVVALASGVWLEVIKGENAGVKDYGLITGVVQLDLVNVATGEGGGYVYAKNEHGIRQNSGATNVTLAAANSGAVSNKRYRYVDSELKPFQTSGNFVHPLKQIVDDCFPSGGNYEGDDASAAHYWFIRGDYYIYNQTISAYTGFSQAYPKSVDIPLTITSGANGKMQLISVDDCKYAYFVGLRFNGEIMANSDSIQVGNEFYTLNEPISNWAWEHLTEEEQDYFVPMTYVCSNDVLNYDNKAVDINNVDLGDNAYLKGDVILPDSYEALKTVFVEIYNEDTPRDLEDKKTVSVASFFRKTNSISKENGFVLTMDANNPSSWDDYYSHSHLLNQITESTYDNLSLSDKQLYVEGPSFHCNTSGTYGQRDYLLGDVIDKYIYDSQSTLQNEVSGAGLSMPSDQADFEQAYVALEDVHVWTMSGGQLIDMFITPGNVISASDYNRTENKDIRSKFERGLLCVNSVLVEAGTQVLYGEVIGITDYNELIAQYPQYQDNLKEAYICTTAGKFGGKLYIDGNNYLALDWNTLSKTERDYFTFNKDALDLLSQDLLNVNISLYDPESSVDPNGDALRYSGSKSINYQAVYEDNSTLYIAPYNAQTTDGLVDVTKGKVLDNFNYEKLPNERRHYSRIEVSVNDVNNDSTIYVANSTFRVGDIYYNCGKVLRQSKYDLLSAEDRANFDMYRFSSSGTYYVCKENYQTIGAITTLTSVSDKYSLDNRGNSIPVEGLVSKGTVISADEYSEHVTNKQSGFLIKGVSPQEVTTLYVTRDADIRELSQDRIITVALKYSYLESDLQGNNFEEIIERHILNIRVHFESGVPTIGDIQAPSAVLPGSAVGMTQPRVIPGAYAILGGGWEVFTNENDAYAQKNGSYYDNSRAPLYWFQNGYWISYYAKSFLGKTYSNPVPLTVANYHRMESVFNHPEHLYIDSVYVKAGVQAMKRPAKIYIDDHTCADNTYNELDYFYKFFTDTLTIAGDVDALNKPLTTLNSQVKDAENLIFIVQANVAPKKYSNNWNSLGTVGHCFNGEFIGNGYTISELNSSLFGSLCGNVYNLGVQGTFTGSGIADIGGKAENCWVLTDGTPSNTVRPVMGTGIIKNCYYLNTDYTKPYVAGDATSASSLEFLNGKVAYNLNGYYLQKRQDISKNRRHENSDGIYYMLNSDGTAFDKISAATNTTDSYERDYVEDIMKDGDFRFSRGVISNNFDIRYDKESANYYPIYPDDYIFFGQTLSFGGVQGKTQDGNPENIAKSQLSFTEIVDDEDFTYKVLLIDNNTIEGNRVFRAPAYYSDNASLLSNGVHFNKDASFVSKFSWLGNEYLIDDNLTAIDFTGKNDVIDGSNAFFGPWLDYEGLNSMFTNGITRNLLVYADPIKDASTYSLLRTIMNEPQMEEGDDYHDIDVVNPSSYPLFHLVDKQTDGSYLATTDHFLVDKQSFAAPIAYKFGSDGLSDCYMWYQRKPSRYANGVGQEAWEGLVLPFTADLVTTQNKGEITHFFNEEASGHEYWLRGFSGVTSENSQKIASFIRPKSSNGEGFDDRNAVADYTVANSFLWDYYYSANTSQDKNGDTYKEYYSNARDYSDYVFTTENVPYIVAFPGVKYYEFDMSGIYIPQNTAQPIPAKLQAQIVTYVSKAEQEISVYDASQLKTRVGNYDYLGTFSGKMDYSGSNTYYKIDGEGHGFERSTDQSLIAVPFRTYMSYSSSSPAPTKGAPEYIPIGQDSEYDAEHDTMTGSEGLDIWGKNGVIHIVSSLDREVEVNIYSAAGQLIKRQLVAPGSHQRVIISSNGVYLVNREKVIL